MAASRLADTVPNSGHMRPSCGTRSRCGWWSTTARLVSSPAAVVSGEKVMPGRRPGWGYAVISTTWSRRSTLPTGSWVVLGEPGAGKTVLACCSPLACSTLAHRTSRCRYCCRSLWNPLAELCTRGWPAVWSKTIRLWPTRRHGPDAAGRLVYGGRLIPVLDGLDEMPPALRDAAIEALDRVVADSGPLVVTCRSDEYRSGVAASGRFLSRAAVVEIEPVDVKEASSSSPPPRRSAIRAGSGVRPPPCLPDGSLAQALSTPLRSTWPASPIPIRHQPAELCHLRCFIDRVALEEHFLDAYLPSVCLTPDQASAVIPRRTRTTRRIMRTP